MTGVRLFAARLRREPLRALGALGLDYATFAAMCAFCLLLWALRAPLGALARRTGRPIRERLIDAVARVAHA